MALFTLNTFINIGEEEHLPEQERVDKALDFIEEPLIKYSDERGFGVVQIGVLRRATAQKGMSEIFIQFETEHGEQDFKQFIKDLTQKFNFS